MNLGFGNNVRSTLAADINATQTTIQVMPGTGIQFANTLIPDAGMANPSISNIYYAKVTLTDSQETVFEICHLLSVSEDTLTVIRGQEGTTAKGWSLADVISNFATRGSENNFVQIEDLQSGKYLSANAGGTENTLSISMPSMFFINNGNTFNLRQPLLIYPKFNNTGACTIQLTVSGRVIGTYPVIKGNLIPLNDGDITLGAPLIVTFCPDIQSFQAINPATGLADFEDLEREISKKISGALNFSTGGTLKSTKDFMFNDADHSWYYWTGDYSGGGKVVPPNSTPDTAGGVGQGKWINASDTVLRADLLKVTGAGNVKTKTDNTVEGSIRASSGASQGLFPRLMGKLSHYRYGYGGQTLYRAYGYGSSVGNAATLPDKETQSPIAKFFEYLNGTVNKGSIYPLSFQNNSVDGSAINDFLAKQWPETVATGIYPDVALFVYGMNDFATALYNGGQTLGENGFEARLEAAIQKIQEAGGDVVLTTTPHPYSATMNWSMPPTVNQSWPKFVPMPVSDADIIPPADASIIEFVWNEVIIKVSERYLRGNDVIRRVAVRMGCVLLDVEKYWFDAIAKYGESALFNPGQNVHPNLFGHQQSYWKAFQEFFANLDQNGWVAPDASYNSLLTVGGTALYPQPARADVDLMASGVRENAFAVRDKFSRSLRRFSQDGIETLSSYTSQSPTTGAPGYSISMERRLDRGGGLFQAGAVFDIPIPNRSSSRIFFEAWSSSQFGWAQADDFIASNREGVITVGSGAKVDNTPGGNRLYTISAIANGVRLTVNTGNTSLKTYTESFS
jgi:hypothetical protein